MKKLIILLFICFGFAKVQAQTFTKYADTANYLIHQIENKKNLYVGKPLSVLLDSLKIQPVKVITGATPQKSDFGKEIRFYFNLERIFDKKHFITIDFESVPNYDQIFPVFFPTAGGHGSAQNIISVYKALIVKDVSVKDYKGGDTIDPNVHY